MKGGSKNFLSSYFKIHWMTHRLTDAQRLLFITHFHHQLKWSHAFCVWLRYFCMPSLLVASLPLRNFLMLNLENVCCSHRFKLSYFCHFFIYIFMVNKSRLHASERHRHAVCIEQTTHKSNLIFWQIFMHQKRKRINYVLFCIQLHLIHRHQQRAHAIWAILINNICCSELFCAFPFPLLIIIFENSLDVVTVNINFD